MFTNSSETLQLFLGNFSFCILFLAMICYWIDTAFADYTFPFSLAPTTGPGVPLEVSRPKLKMFRLETFANICMLVTNFSLVFLLLLRWQESGHFPLSNLYESLIFLCWCCTSIHLGILLTINKTLFGKSSDLFFGKLLGSITSPCALFTNAYATFSLPKEMQSAAPLVPALQSNWLMMHVTVMILSYSALILGSLLAISFLIVTSKPKIGSLAQLNNSLASLTVWGKPKLDPIVSPDPFAAPQRGDSKGAEGKGVASFQLESSQVRPKEELRGAPKKNRNNLSNPNQSSFLDLQIPLLSLDGERDAQLPPFAKNLDNLSYRILGIGFPFLTIGILSGAVWANEAWGSYWSWDPKETWAFLTWLVFAIYLHMRLSHGWQGKKPALMASFGFLTVWFCFLGVNLLGEGLHSYGWILN